MNKRGYRKFNIFKDQHSWTLIEMVMVIVIISVIAGMGVIKINDMIQAGRVTKAAADVNIIRRALLTYFGDYAAFPAEVAAGVDPGLAPNYMTAWPSDNPWGGEYDYEYGTYANFNRDGSGGNEVYISIDKGSADLTSSVCSEVDNLLDDGTTSSGDVRSDGSTYIYIYVGEGPNS